MVIAEYHGENTYNERCRRRKKLKYLLRWTIKSIFVRYYDVWAGVVWDNASRNLLASVPILCELYLLNKDLMQWKIITAIIIA